MKQGPHPLRTTDISSFPLVRTDHNQYAQGAVDLEDGKHTIAAQYFQLVHNETFQKKYQALGTNLGVPCYIQSSYQRDMLNQFLDPIVRKGKGLQKQNNQYFWNGDKIHLPPTKAKIGELIALKAGAKSISKNLNVARINYRACITGPFELMIRLSRDMGIRIHYSEQLMDHFTQICAQYFSNAYFETKYLTPTILALDEPSIGVTGIEEFFVDSDSDMHLSHLIRCWNKIYDTVPITCYRGIHLHASPYQRLSQAKWNLLEAHMGVVVAKKWLVEHDKYIRAAIMRTDGPSISEGVDPKLAWDNIQAGKFQSYLQTQDDMRHHLKQAIDRYGIERVPFAGPECGLGPWDWKYGQEMALTSLSNVYEVVKAF